MSNQENIDALQAEFVFIVHNILQSDVVEASLARIAEAIGDNDKFYGELTAEWRERLVKDKAMIEENLQRSQTNLAAVEAKLAELPDDKRRD